MKIKSKEELKEALVELRKGKEKNGSYKIINTNPNMACCYSIAMPRYKTGHYIGRHKCVNCGIDFGTDCNDEIESCKEKRYAEYLKSQYLFSYEYPCFNEFYKNYNNKNSKVLSYLKDCKLKFTNHNQYSNYPDFSLLKLRDEHKNKDKVVSFNRPLTKDEWVKLNTNCNKKHCFSLDARYGTYQDVYEKYKSLGYDVRLEYNCPKCCSKGRNEIEFWFRLNGDTDYVISKPPVNGSGILKYSSYSEYMSVLDFLNGCTSYSELVNKSNERDDNMRKSYIDIALNKIVGANIKYDKKEIERYIKEFYYIEKDGQDANPKSNDIEINMINHCALLIFYKVLSMYDDNYQFSMQEYFVLMDNVAELKEYEIRNLNIISKTEIIEKRTIFYLKGIDNKLTNKAIFDYLDIVYPKGDILEKCSSNYEIKRSKEYTERREIVFNLFNMIFDVYGNDFHIPVSLFDKIINYFEKEFWHYEEQKEFKDIRQTVLTKEFLKNIVEGE